MAPVRENGVNMLGVKKKNRGAILQLIHENGSISRKDIAHSLGLTPAAITMITGELLEEGIIGEGGIDNSVSRKGRREILLRLNGERYAALGVYITRHKFRLLCVDLNNNTIFEDLIQTSDCQRKAHLILDKVVETVRKRLKKHNITQRYTIVGLGVSTNGIVDSVQGISVNPFQVWEEREVPVAKILEASLEIPVLLTNNICSLTHGESALGERRQNMPMLFVKYGPGLGAAHSLGDGGASVFNYKAIQMGHIISDPHGLPCVCGNRGCFETILHYDSIENTIKGMLSEKRTPVLWEITDGDPARVSMPEIIKSYNADERVVEQTLERVVFHLCIAIKNGITLFDPESVVLYGELFENKKFREAVQKELNRYTQMDMVSFSRYNMGLETFGPASTVVSLFFENGGIR